MGLDCDGMKFGGGERGGPFCNLGWVGFIRFLNGGFGGLGGSASWRCCWDDENERASERGWWIE